MCVTGLLGVPRGPHYPCVRPKQKLSTCRPRRPPMCCTSVIDSLPAGSLPPAPKMRPGGVLKVSPFPRSGKLKFFYNSLQIHQIRQKILQFHTISYNFIRFVTKSYNFIRFLKKSYSFIRFVTITTDSLLTLLTQSVQALESEQVRFLPLPSTRCSKKHAMAERH